MKRFFFLLIYSIYSIIFFPLSGYTQTVPDAAQSGVVNRESDSISPTQESDEDAITDESHAKEDKASPRVYHFKDLLPEIKQEQTIFKLETILIEGNVVISDDYFQAQIQPYLSENITLERLRAIVSMVEQAYRQEGYILVRAILPEQDIDQGHAIIQVIEGSVGQIAIEGNHRYAQEFIDRYIDEFEDRPFHYPTFLKQLLILNELPAIRVQSYLKKGDKPAETKIILKVVESDFYRLALDANNYGSRYVSRQRLGVLFQKGYLFLPGDQWTVRGVSGTPQDTLSYGYLNYEMPLHTSGTSFGLTALWSDFDVQREFRSLDSGGDLYAFGLNLKQPLVRTHQWKIDGHIQYFYKGIKNYLLGSISSEDNLDLLTLRFDALSSDKSSYRDTFVVSLTTGHNSSKVNPSRAGAYGRFHKSNLNASRLKRLTTGLYAYVEGSLQAASGSLPAAEQMSIGGAETVRGFPQSEYLGDHGYLTTIELRSAPFSNLKWSYPWTKTRIAESLQFVTFLDHGYVRLADPLPGEQKDDHISGAGVGLRLDLKNGLQVRADWGFPVSGPEPSDGSNSALYLSLAKDFIF